MHDVHDIVTAICTVLLTWYVLHFIFHFILFISHSIDLALSNDTATDRQRFCTAVCTVHCWSFAIMLWMWDSGVCSRRDCIIYQNSMLSSLECWSIHLLFLAVCLMLGHCQFSTQQWLNLKLDCKNKIWN